jgi:pimeloyl-ACP methyl ester carboxylesterase
MISPCETEIDAALGCLAGLRSDCEGQPKVIALHGWLDNAASFVPLMRVSPMLDMLALDLPGHGRSAHLPPGAEYGHGVAINSVLDVADALGWRRFGLLGHSMGAGIACLIAAAVPSRITRLAVIDLLGPLSEVPESTAELLRRRISAMRDLPSKPPPVFPDLTVPIRARMQINRLSESNARLLVERGTVPAEGGFRWSTDVRLTLPDMRRMSEAQIRNLLANIECPVRVIFAEPAPSGFPDRLRRERSACLRQAKVSSMPGIHHLHMENPIAVADAIGDHYQE